MKAMRRPAMLGEEKKISLGQVAVFVLIAFGVLVLLVQSYLSLFCFGVVVDGASMENTFFDGEFVYARRTQQASRGDVIIIDVTKYKEHDHISGDFIIKRLIAVEGDTVCCEEGVVYVKAAGEEEFHSLSEPYAKGETEDFPPVSVGKGEIYFLGDNRTVSYDSRRLGCYLAEDIAGVVPDWAIAVKGFTTAWNGL